MNAARIGAAETDAVNITFVDSEQLTMGLGLLAINAANFAAAGKRIDQIVSSIEERIPRTFVFGLLDTLEYLRRSGRLGWAEFRFGTLLNIKPMVRVHTGNVEMLEKVKADEVAKDIPVIILTNLGDRPEDVEKCKKLGAEDYWIKANISLKEVIARIRKILGEK